MQATLTKNTIEKSFSQVLQSLSEKERVVIERRIGINGEKKLSKILEILLNHQLLVKE